MTMTNLLDSNILVYALASNSPFHQSIGEFLIKSKEEKIKFVAAHQNVIESHRILTTRYKENYHECLKKLLNLTNKIGLKIIYPKQDTLKNYIKLVNKQKKLTIDHFDNYLAATMLSNNIKTIHTANEKDFEGIKEIKVVNPLK